METKISNGDYVSDGLGGVERCKGTDALLERVLFRLTARRGQFPPLPELGSRLHLLSREPTARRQSAAAQYVAEALAEEDVTVKEVSLAPEDGGRVRLTVLLDYRGEALNMAVTV